MCKIQVPQEDADRILTVGQKVLYEGQEAVITSIRVWHDLGTLLGPPHRAELVFDLHFVGGSVMNISLNSLKLWRAPPPMPSIV